MPNTLKSPHIQGGVFYFTFTFEDDSNESEETLHSTYGFIFSPSIISPGSELTEDDWFEELFGQIEDEFGVHDFCSSPVDSIIGIAYTTYEVPKNKALACVERWRQAFVDKFGQENVSTKTHYLGDNHMDSDLEAFELCKQKESVNF